MTFAAAKAKIAAKFQPFDPSWIAARLANVDLTPYADVMDDEENDYVIPFGTQLPLDVSPENGNISLLIKLTN